MRAQDKARAHLQSAMKYLGFGMTPDELKAFEESSKERTEGHVRYDDTKRRATDSHSAWNKEMYEKAERRNKLYNNPKQAKKLAQDLKDESKRDEFEKFLKEKFEKLSVGANVDSSTGGPKKGARSAEAP